MTGLRTLLLVAAAVPLAGGCVYRFPFDHRATFEAVQTAARSADPAQGPVALRWAPSTFPERVDVQGPAGREGSGRKAEIPTGVMLARRTTELLDAAFGVDPRAARILTIEVEEAESVFTFDTRGVDRDIGSAGCTVIARFDCDGVQWTDRFAANAAANEDGRQRGPGLLEEVWDAVALQITASVALHLSDLPPAPAVPAPAVPVTKSPETDLEVPRASPLTPEEVLEAMRAALIEKQRITPEEWDAELARILERAGT